jgi:signal transduction histidine kinase
MAPLIRRTSIAARLTWMNILVSGVALLVACVAFLTYDFFAYRQAEVESLSGMARIVGANSVSAIIFNDQASAQATLSALSSASDVSSAVIYTASGNPFAEYVRDGSVPTPRDFSQNSMQADWIDGLDLVTGSRIVFQGKTISTVYIHATLRRQAIQDAEIVGIILLLCLVVASLVGNTFRRVLAEPVVSLAQTARLVSRSKDYNLRFAPPQDYEELLSLTEAFNEMLSEIERRDAALETAKTDLEIRVDERTAQLQAANQEMEAFSYTVAHDLRSPLQAINNICFLMGLEEGSSSPEKQSMLSHLRDSVTAMSTMIDDLLDLSRSTSAELHLSEIDLAPLATLILEGLAAANPDRRATTIIHPNCHVHADPGLIQIVLQNLLRNAWKFTSRREASVIEFGCTREDGRTVIFVRDNGAGFDPLLADRLFKPFHRLHQSVDFPGTGIGLATVRRIVSRHGGKVWAEGEVEKGATFYFTLEQPGESK